MNRQLDHMVRLVGDLLDVARINGGTLELRRESVTVLSVIERAIETTAPLFSARNQSVVVDAEGPVPAFVDATRIAQIVANLLNNASKHSPLGAQVRVELRCPSDVAIVKVIDDGIGIPVDQLDRVFDMFTKIERAAPSTNDGLGIGLSLSRQFAERHGGTLTATSAGAGRGATFTLSVPTGQSERVAEAEGAASAIPEGVEETLNIVVVEDNEDSADMMTTWLEHLGHRVQVARNGPDGVELILGARPDVVLCDLGLPGMDGADVCRHIVDGMPFPPVMVALTGWGADPDRQRTVEAGFRHHLVKPVELDELRRVLQSVGQARSE
jgi:CheY-like chemotaxis protein